MEQDRKPRNEPKTIWSIYLQQIKKGYPMEKKVSPTNGIGKTGQQHAKE